MLELFTSVADALISYAIDKLDPAEQIKSWLRLDPTRLAFNKSLVRAYSAFARQYPEYTSSLFDQSFLSTDALPELSKLLTRDQHPNPALLAQMWGRSLGANEDFAQIATKPAAYFIERFEAELRAEPALHSIFDSRALESLPKLEEEIQKLSTELKRGLDEALKVAQNYQQATIRIGGDVKGEGIVIGNNNNLTINKYDYSNHYYYSGDFITLDEFYIPTDGVFQRVRVDEFVGRDWLTAKVDAFLNDPNRKSGAFLLIGDAGVGKTSFMAHLVKERRYLHLFAQQAPGQAMLQRAMQSLGSQLVTRYQIAPYKDRNTLNSLSVFPDFLERILRLAASTLTEGEKIVIVCDALDEAGVFPDHFVFGLPKELPNGVYFILSQRPVNVKLPNFEPVIEKLEAQGEGNLQDMEAYLNAVAKRPEVTGQIRSKEYSEEFFIQTLKEKSQGVWMYLHYIIKEIESGARAPLDLANLPTGLVGYYADYWDAWRTGKRGKGEDAWDELYAPLLSTLATTQEAIPVDWLTQWAGVNAKPREITRLLTEHWRAFIIEKEEDGQKIYIPYHLSFKDFIAGRVDISKLPPAQANLVKDLAAWTVDAHKRIVSFFEEECNGEWEKLVEQDYPRLHMTSHLNEAGEYEKLRILLTEGDEKIKWAEARLKKEGTYTGYLSDLVYIREYASQKKKTDLLIRCTLIESSIRSWAPNIPPVLLAEAGKAGIWSYTRCLAAVRQNLNSTSRERSLLLLIKHLPTELHQEALSIASETKDAFILIVIALYLNDELQAKAIANANKIKSESEIARILYMLVLIEDENKDEIEENLELDEKQLIQALAIASKLNGDLHLRARALIATASRTKNKKIKNDAIQEALAIAKTTKYPPSDTNSWFPYPHAQLLITLAPHLNEDQIADVHAMINDIKDVYWHIRALVALAPKLDENLRENVINEVLSIAKDIKDESSRANALFALIPLLHEEKQEKALQEVVSITMNIKDDDYYAGRFMGKFNSKSENIIVLSTLIPHLNKELREKTLREFLSIARGINDISARVNALIATAPLLDEEGKTKVLLEALSVIGEIEEVVGNSESRGYPRTNVFKDIAPFLNTEHLQEKAFSVLNDFKTPSERGKALIALIPHLNSEKNKEKALSIASEIKDNFKRVRAFAVFAPHLSQTLKEKTLQQALYTAGEIYESEADGLRAYAFNILAPLLNNKLKSKALSIVTNNDSKIFAYATTLISLAQYFKDNELKDYIFQHASSIMENIENVSSRALALTFFASQLTNDDLKEKTLQKAVLATSKIEDSDENYIFALTALAHNLNYGPLKSKLLQEALSKVDKIKFESSRSAALTDLIPRLNNDKLKNKALSMIGKIKYESDRVEALVALIPHLDNDELKAKALSFIEKIKNESDRAEALVALVPHLNSDELKNEALSIISKFYLEYNRAEAFVALIPLLKSDDLKTKAFSMIGNTEEKFWRASALTGLAPLFEDKVKSIDAIQEALSNANEVESVYWHAYALIALVPMLEGKQQHDVFQEAFSVARKIEDAFWRASVLTTLAQHAEGELKQKVLEEAILSIVDIHDYKSKRTKVLSTIAPLLNNNELKNKTLSMIGKIEGGSDQANVLMVLAPYLNNDELIAKAFEIAEKIDSEYSRTNTLATLILQFNGITQNPIVHQNINSYIAFLGQKDRASALLGIQTILPALIDFSGGEFADELLKTIQDTARWWPFADDILSENSF